MQMGPSAARRRTGPSPPSRSSFSRRPRCSRLWGRCSPSLAEGWAGGVGAPAAQPAAEAGARGQGRRAPER
eukprot:scaffold10820_cov132-Isochrysis_galbana.AAC.4